MIVELERITPDAEAIIEKAGRVCHDSTVSPGTREGFIRKLVGLGHESVLEHASATFHVSGCSRVMTHQLVRHRLMSFSQRSQRYVDESCAELVAPAGLRHVDVEEYNKDVNDAFSLYAKWLKKVMRKEDARFLLPQAVATEIYVTGNFRTWRHFIRLRASLKAQKEIREMAVRVLDELHGCCPSVFEDLKKHGG